MPLIMNVELTNETMHESHLFLKISFPNSQVTKFSEYILCKRTDETCWGDMNISIIDLILEQ